MKKLKLLFLSALIMLFTACGTETKDTNPNRFDMWDYMTASPNYKVQYKVYENDLAVDYEIEEHKKYGNEKYVRDGKDGIITLTANSSTILMEEHLQNVTIDRYLHLGDKNIFKGKLIKSCTFEQFYKKYEIKDVVFHNVLRVDCESKKGVKQEYYYGYNEGVVSIYTDDGTKRRELVKVSESTI